MNLFSELKRRNVFREGAAYLVAAWIFAQVASLVLGSFKAPDGVMQASLLLLVVGFILALVISWAYEITTDGIKREKKSAKSDVITPIRSTKIDFIALVAALTVTSLIAWQLTKDLISNPNIDGYNAQDQTVKESFSSVSGQLNAKIAKLG